LRLPMSLRGFFFFLVSFISRACLNRPKMYKIYNCNGQSVFCGLKCEFVIIRILRNSIFFRLIPKISVVLFHDRYRRNLNARSIVWKQTGNRCYNLYISYAVTTPGLDDRTIALKIKRKKKIKILFLNVWII